MLTAVTDFLNSVRLRDLPALNRRPRPDDKSRPGGQDRTRINVNEDYEIKDWSDKLGVSKDELKKAVAKVGTLPKWLENTSTSDECHSQGLPRVLSLSTDPHPQTLEEREQALRASGFDVISVTSASEAQLVTMGQR